MNRKSRFTALTTALVLVSFILSTAVSMISLHILSRNNMRDLDTLLASRVHAYVGKELSEPTTVARTMRHSSFIIDALEEESAGNTDIAEQSFMAYLQGIQSGLSYTTAFIVSEATRNYYTSDGLSRTIHPEDDPADDWYTQFIESDANYDLDVDTDPEYGNELVFFVNEKVFGRDDSLLGVCGVGIQMTNLQELITSLEEEYSVKISLVDSNSVIQIDTDAAQIGQIYSADLTESSEKRDEYVYHSSSGHSFTITKYIENLNWYLIVKDVRGDKALPYLNILLINILLFGLVFIIMIISMRHLRKQTEALSNASFKDQLTQLYNRRAYEEDKFEWTGEGLSRDFVHIAADVNGLKTANDTLGHEAGDELIKGAAECLSRCCAGYGRVYRTGGDEFAVILTVKEHKLQEILSDIEQTVSAYKGRLNKSLSVSVGSASVREFPGEDIEGIIRISDERMYAAKAEHYTKSGIDRRHR
ncbi:MAG: diguanylate cyclase [Blautia sp.]|nr:diguanylate cyclase [Blautia sp.]